LKAQGEIGMLQQTELALTLPKKVKLSKFCHVYRKGNAIALFHTLRVKTIFLEDEKNGLIDSLLNRQEVHTVNMSDEQRIFLDELLKLNILVENEQKDSELLEQISGDYTGAVDISLMYLMLTDQCNLACKYCFIEGGMPSAHKFSLMDEATSKKAIDFFISKAHLCDDPEHKPSIIFYGGEPTLNWEVLKNAVLYIKQKIKDSVLPEKIEINLITNGTLLDEQMIGFIKENGVSLSISFDGAGEHNDARIFHNGSKSTDKVLQTFDLLRKAEIPISISCTINPYNQKNIREIAQWFCEQKVATVGFNILLDAPNNPPASDELIHDTVTALTDCYETFRNHGIYEDRIGRKVKAFTEEKIYPFDCGGYGGQIVIAPDGQIGICHAYLGDRKYFNFNVNITDNFDLENDSNFQEWSNRSPLNMPQCYECPVLGICGGGCAKNAEMHHKSIWDLDDRFCKHAKHTLEWMIWDLHSIVSSQPQPSQD
jgi:uncharacterized protein